MDTALLIFLILLNGAFAMAEMGLTAARKARLQVMVETGDGGARAAMALHDDPTRWLSTVQIGITSIGLLNGIVGEAAFAQPLAEWLVDAMAVPPNLAQIAATALVVVLITYATIVFGELVPKRLGQMYPEPVARIVARPMLWISTATKPFVMLLSGSTVAFDAGVIEAQEHQMVRNVFRLDERQIGSMMIPRAEIDWIDADAGPDEVRRVLDEAEHSRYPVCRGGLDDVVGVVSAQRLLHQLVHGRLLSVTEGLNPPVFVPETLSGMELLEHFKASGAELVFVVDEYGAVQGIITVRDVLEAITGEFTPAEGDEEAWAVRRDDGSWLLDGLIPVPELKDRLQLRELPDEERGRYNTLAGMIMLLLGRLPQVTDHVEWQGWRFEVVDMDGKRVDKVLVSPHPIQGEPL